MDYQINPNQNFQNTPPPNLPVEPPTPEPVMPGPIMPPAPPPPVYTPPIAPKPYSPPVPNFSKLPKERKGFSVFSIVVAVIAILAIAGLSFALYYFATKPFPSVPVTEIPVNNTNTNTPEQPPITTPPVVPTNVITFSPPSVLPADQKQGTCVASIAQPYKQDAFRCSSGGKIYDPCFATADSVLVFCQIDPLSSAPFVIKVTKPLPAITLPSLIKDNWAWFVKLKDGTVCSPFTGTNFGGTKPVVNGEAAVYGCKSIVTGEQVLLIGDLSKGTVWTAQKSIVTKQGAALVEKSSQPVEIDTVWQ